MLTAELKQLVILNPIGNVVNGTGNNCSIIQMDPNQKEIMDSLVLVVNANTVLQVNFTSTTG